MSKTMYYGSSFYQQIIFAGGAETLWYDFRKYPACRIDGVSVCTAVKDERRYSKQVWEQFGKEAPSRIIFLGYYIPLLDGSRGQQRTIVQWTRWVDPYGRGH